MRAVVREAGEVALREVPRPAPQSPDDVLIRVAVAGICRTDLYAARGLIGGTEALILGHELAGSIAAVGSGVTSLQPGDRVTVIPWVDCGTCAGCLPVQGTALRPCLRPRMLGVDLPGGFAEYVCVPAGSVHRLPDGLSFPAGAYVEPIAASLAVLSAGITPSQCGLIYGENRIARLTLRILEFHGFERVELLDPSAGSVTPEEAAYDFVIETVATAPALAQVVRSVRPGGVVVLKSRPCRPVEVDLRSAVLKNLTLRAVNYGSWPAAIELAGDPRFDVDDLLGPVFPLEQFQEGFRAAEGAEARKVFLSP